jgi:sugar-specific transcriptional regulator TrmB
MVTVSIELELIKLGLTEKEVRVYLVDLELGSKPVKKITKMAKITRPTTYEIIKKLKEKGLFAKPSRIKKTIFRSIAGENFKCLKNSKERN